MCCVLSCPWSHVGLMMFCHSPCRRVSNTVCSCHHTTITTVRELSTSLHKSVMQNKPAPCHCGDIEARILLKCLPDLSVVMQSTLVLDGSAPFALGRCRLFPGGLCMADVDDSHTEEAGCASSSAVAPRPGRWVVRTDRGFSWAS